MIEQLVPISLIVFLAGGIKGFAGFGYAVAGVGLLSIFLGAGDAVILMIVPLITGNLALVAELDVDRLRSCLKNFWPFMMAAAVSSLIGLALIEVVPANIFSVLIGFFLLLYVFSKLEVIGSKFELLAGKCMRKGKVFQLLSGFTGGFIFGSTSIGAVNVVYLEGLDLDYKVFAGLLSFILLFVSVLRIAGSWFMGYYSGNSLLLLSILASFPGLVGVFTGAKLRYRGPDKILGKVVLLLFALIGLRLIIG